MDYQGVIIEESLTDSSILSRFKILETKIEPVTEEHRTPHLKQWTLHTVEIDDDKAREEAEEVGRALDTEHGHWYADFKNDKMHYIIFHDKIFHIRCNDKSAYDEVVRHGLSLGIPEYQLDFSSEIL